MKVELLQPRASALGPQNAGDQIEVSDAEAKRMIEAGTARPVRSQKAPEKAVRSGKAARG